MKVDSALIQVIKESRGSLGVANAPLNKIAHSHIMAMVFREPFCDNGEVWYNTSLFVKACVKGMHMRSALVDGGSGVNIIPANMFAKLRIVVERVKQSRCTLSKFHGQSVRALGHVTLNLDVVRIKTTNTFHIAKGNPRYHILLGRP